MQLGGQANNSVAVDRRHVCFPRRTGPAPCSLRVHTRWLSRVIAASLLGWLYLDPLPMPLSFHRVLLALRDCPSTLSLLRPPLVVDSSKRAGEPAASSNLQLFEAFRRGAR